MPSSANTSVYLSELTHRHVTSSASTNSELIQSVQDGTLNAIQLHLLTAETQSAGRGQRGRSWQSPRGNVYLSLYHPVYTPISGLLSLIIGVELAKMPIIQMLNEQLRAQGLTPIGVKWANDLGFYQSSPKSDKAEPDTQIIQFNKLAGILIEPVWKAGKLVGVVMGVGLNVQAAPKLTVQTCEGMSYQAISLQDIYGMLESDTNNDTNDVSLPTLQALYQQMSKALIAAMTRFEHFDIEKPTGHTYYLDSFLQEFTTMDALTGLRLRVTQDHDDKAHVVTGRACSIDTNGCLQLRQDNGKISALFTGRIDVIREA
ncbi:biotin--[acetyl-CoA-carboxylase] ligase [uncultured Psychrobacter sp.]|uniref:biotin--[acetyl-CoA-carboxylase] ligase n=1 Tax=uncultured Psychrobacter sp. TaxID=259303 RepID=UPI0026388A9A|nr:biotin--[acetyl-CoA-carboxylase] ligase [uncultured Psychrobacter sp.]